MAERQLPKLNVAGSIPVSRSNSRRILVRHLQRLMLDAFAHAGVKVVA